MSSIVVERLYVSAVTAVLLVVAFISFTQPVQSARPDEQEQLYAQVPTALDPKGKPPVAAPAEGPGSALAYLQVPRFGENWLWTVVEGTDEDHLARGPGHYEGSALMGGRGNFVVSGHRAGHGDPFIDFDLLEIGDTVTFRQSGAWWKYRIFRDPEIISPETMWVLNQPAYGRKLTLTTCWPKYGNEKRMFVRAKLVDWSSK
jgi:sortase A